MRASVLLDFRTAGVSEAKRAVQGIVQATQRAANDSKKAQLEEKARIKSNENALRRLATVISEVAKAKAKSEKDAAKQALTAQKQADRAAVESAKKAARDEAAAYRMMHRIRRDQARETARIEREENRASARADRQRAQGVRNMRRGVMQTGAGLATVAATGINEVRGFGSTLGVRSREEMVQRAIEFDQRVGRLGVQTRMTADQRNAMRDNILRASGTTQVDPQDLLQAAELAHGRFSNVGLVTQNIQRIAEASNALGAAPADITAAVGDFQRQMGVRDEQISELIGTMATSANEGSIEFGDLSSEFAPLIGDFQRATGRTGMQGANEFLALAQQLGTGGRGGAGTAVLMQNLLAKLNSADVQRELHRVGINTRENGQFIGMDRLIAEISGNSRLNRNGDLATNLQGVFGRDMQANQALGILVSQFRQAQSAGRGNPLTEMANVGSTNGNAMIAEIQGALLNSTSGRARQVGVNAEIEFMRNGDALIQTMTNMAGPLSELENRFPRVAQGLESFQGAMTNLLAVMAGLRLAGGGAVLASTVNAGAGTAVAGTAVAGAGAGTAAGAAGGGMLIPGLAAAATGYGLYDMFQSGGDRSFITDLMDQIDQSRATERDRSGPTGIIRRNLERRSNWSGSYDAGETSGFVSELENARRMFNGREGGGQALQSVIDKLRDIGAMDEILATGEGRSALNRAGNQISRDREQITDPIVRTLNENATRTVTAIQGIAAPSPATGSTTGPTVPR